MQGEQDWGCPRGDRAIGRGCDGQWWVNAGWEQWFPNLDLQF